MILRDINAVKSNTNRLAVGVAYADKNGTVGFYPTVP